MVTGAPATGTICILHLIGRKHHRQLDGILLIHTISIGNCSTAITPLEVEEEVLAIMRSLHGYWNRTTLTGNRSRLSSLLMFAIYNFGSHFVGLFIMAGETAITTLDEGTCTAMVFTIQDPLHGGLSRVEQGNLTPFNGPPALVNTAASSGGCPRGRISDHLCRHLFSHAVCHHCCGLFNLCLTFCSSNRLLLYSLLRTLCSQLWCNILQLKQFLIRVCMCCIRGL